MPPSGDRSQAVMTMVTVSSPSILPRSGSCTHGLGALRKLIAGRRKADARATGMRGELAPASALDEEREVHAPPHSSACVVATAGDAWRDVAPTSSQAREL